MLTPAEVNPILTAALEKGTGIPVMKCSLYELTAGPTWTLIDQYDILECVLTRERYDIFIQENLLDTGLIDSIVDAGWAVEIERGLIVAGTKYSIVGNLYYVSSVQYSQQEGRTRLIADLLPTTSITAIVGTQTAQQVVQDAFDQFNNLSSVEFDVNRDIWFDWQFYDTNKELNLFDGRSLASVLQQKYFAYLFPRYFHLIYVYGVASNEGNPEDGAYTPFAHAQLTTFLWPDKPVNITWTDEFNVVQEYIDTDVVGMKSLGFVASADDPSALAAFQAWTRIFNGVCYQFVQRPDLRLEQGDLITVPTDGHTLTRCFEQIEVYKTRNSLSNKESKAAWYQIVRQLPYHPAATLDEPPWEPPHPGGSSYFGQRNDPRNFEVQSLSFAGALNKDASNVQQAFEILDAHDHDSAYAPASQGVTNGNSHDHVGGDGAQVDHGGLAGLADDDHTQYIKHALATATSDFLAASGSGSFVKKTLAEAKTILNVDKTIVQILLNTSTALTTGDDKARLRVPAKLNGLNLTAVAASRKSGTGTPSIMIRNVTDAQDMLSTAITIDTGEVDSLTAATAPVINGTYDDVATADQLAIDVDNAGTTTLCCIVELTFG